jgi:DEAD/DEAH box helicase/Helicase conserved C-terminal domain
MESSIATCLRQIDPILQFLTRATGQDRISLPTVRKALPESLLRQQNSDDNNINPNNLDLETIFLHNIEAICSLGILVLHHSDIASNTGWTTSSTTSVTTTSKDSVIPSSTPPVFNEKQKSFLRWDDPTMSIGFPLPSPNHKLHGSTKAAGQRRLAALLQQLQRVQPPRPPSLSNSSGVIDPAENDVAFRLDCSVHKSLDGNEIASFDGSLLDGQICCKDKTVTDSCIDCQESRPLSGVPCTGLIGPEEVENMGSLPKQLLIDEEWKKCDDDDNHQLNAIPMDALTALRRLLGFHYDNDSQRPTRVSVLDSVTMTDILPRQASYAGSTPSQDSFYTMLSQKYIDQLPPILIRALDIDLDDKNCTNENSRGRRLYSHQVAAIEAALDGVHCTVCTGTGSGKSMCYLLPALSAAYNFNQTSLLLFPTKALAQDQLSKLLALVSVDDDLRRRIRPATLDGDTPFAARTQIKEYNIILTNPDILHTSILPAWKSSSYQPMLASLRYIAIDEAHTYDGVFGAHVAMIIRRLIRVSAVAAVSQVNPTNSASSKLVGPPTFIATSATLPWPAEHFQFLCPIESDRTIKVISSEDDGSPRSAKYFFVWNPPVLKKDGTSLGKIYFPRPKVEQKTDRTKKDLVAEAASAGGNFSKKRFRATASATSNDDVAVAAPAFVDVKSTTVLVDSEHDVLHSWTSHPFAPTMAYRRRHAADETARLFVRAVANGVRCIAFCKTRNLVEWVYSKVLEALQSNPSTTELSSRVESYRGGYTVTERRKIEERLFQNKILGVVGTNALELGVDIGGIDLSLHCGYPSSYSSLLQQVSISTNTSFLFY